MFHLPKTLALFLALSFGSTSAIAAMGGVPNPQPLIVVSGDIRIAGEIHRNSENDARTALIIIGGSGVGEREDTAQAIGLFESAQADIVIFDRRGFGGSSGEIVVPGTENSTWLIPELGRDVAMIVEALADQGYTHIGLVGASMGAWISTSAATNIDNVDFIVNFVGGGVSVQISDAYDSLTDQGLTQEDALARAGSISTTIGYDPAADLGNLDAAVLFILAEDDLSNPSRLDISEIEGHRSAGSNLQYILVPDADHDFRNTITGEPNLTWLPEMLAFIQNFSGE